MVFILVLVEVIAMKLVFVRVLGFKSTNLFLVISVPFVLSYGDTAMFMFVY